MLYLVVAVLGITNVALIYALWKRSQPGPSVQVAELEHALKYYANIENYRRIEVKGRRDPGMHQYTCPVEADCGARARHALTGEV